MNKTFKQGDNVIANKDIQLYRGKPCLRIPKGSIGKIKQIGIGVQVVFTLEAYTQTGYVDYSDIDHDLWADFQEQVNKNYTPKLEPNTLWPWKYTTVRRA